MSGGGGHASDSGGYDYEVKRQRVLQGGSSASPGMLASYHQVSQTHQNQPSFTSPSAASLQSTIAASLNSYFAATSAATPSVSQQLLPQRGDTSGMYNSYHAPQAAALASSTELNPSGQFSNPSINHHHVSNSIPDVDPVNTAGPLPTSLNSGIQHPTNPSSPHVNPNFTNDAGRNPNHISYPNSGHRASYASAGFYPFTGSSAPLSSTLSPYHLGSTPGLTVGQHPAASPLTPPLPMMPCERRSTHLARTPPMMPPPFFNGPGFPPFPSSARFFPVVRLRGLPFNCTESDIYEFFKGLDVVDVLLTHKQGRFTGEGYCVLGMPIQVEYALQRNRQSMGQRYVEVFRSKKHEYYMAVAGEVEDQEKPGTREAPRSFASSRSTTDKEHLEHTGVLKLRGLPFSASKRDVIDFFKDFDLKDENVQFVVHSDGRATGEAYVEFDGPIESKQAMCRDKMMLGSRYVELFPSSSEEAARATGRFKN